MPPLAEPEAVELFCARSRLEPDEAIAELCRRLDDLPLALELAAARTSVLSPAQILERLSQRLDLLKGGRDAEPRQQTLRATIEWSHDLLDDRRAAALRAAGRLPRRLHARGGRGGRAAPTSTRCSRSSTRACCATRGERFWMLETIREYARERLAESGDGGRAAPAATPSSSSSFAEPDRREPEEGRRPSVGFVARIAAEHDNLRGALEWARDRHEGEVLLRLAAALVSFWRVRGHRGEARAWLTLALERASTPARAHTKALAAAGWRALMDEDIARAEMLIGEWRDAAEQAEDEEQLMSAMNAAAIMAHQKGDTDGARAELIRIAALAAERGDRSREAAAALNLGALAMVSGDYRAGIEYSTRAAELLAELHKEDQLAMAYLNCGWSALGLGDAGLAEESFRQALLVAEPLAAERLTALAVEGLAAAFVAKGEKRRGTQLLGAAEALSDDLEGSRDDHEEQILERAVSDGKAALGEAAFAAAWARGRAMGREEILALCHEK